MKEMIFIDTSAFVALNNEEDINHKKAIEWVKNMLSETVGLCTNMQVIAETSSQLKKSVNYEKSKRFLKLLENPGIQILEDNEELQQEAWKLFMYKDEIGDVSFFDYWKVSTMNYYGVIKIFTFETFFDKLQVIRVPKK